MNVFEFINSNCGLLENIDLSVDAKDDLDAELPDKDDDENPDIKLKDPANPTDAEIAKFSRMIK